MKTKDLGWILNLQAKTGRTQSGRDIGKALKQRIEKCLGSITSEDFIPVECQNCKMVAQDMDFVNGCPNCGSKDWKEFGESIKIEKE